MDERRLKQLIFLLFFFDMISWAVSLDPYSKIIESNYTDSKLGSISSHRKMISTSTTMELVDSKVIGDVIDIFNPTAELLVRYPSKQVENGEEFTQSQASMKPNVNFTFLGPSHPNNLFTLVMVDPDAPGPRIPILREFLHWMVTNIPEGADLSRGEEVVPYLGPMPILGIHRYVFVLFRQKGPIRVTTPLRVLFDTRKFAAQNELGPPVAALYFISRSIISV